MATAQSLAAQAAAGTLASSALAQAVVENQAETAFNVALNAALNGLADAQGQAVETLTNALAAAQASEEATLAAADLTFVTNAGAADVTWTAALWGDQPPNAPPGQPAGGWVSYVAGSGGVAVSVVQLLEQAAADLVSALALSAEQTVTRERPLLHAHAVTLADARYAVEQELVTHDLQGRVDWLDYESTHVTPDEYEHVRADRPDSVAWFILDELIYENTYGRWIDVQENWHVYVLGAAGFLDGLSAGIVGGLLEGVDTYVFDGVYEIAPARESDAWQAGYRAGAITRDIVLLVAAPGCGAGLFVRVLRVASIKEQIEEFTTAAVNIASGEGTGWDYATVVLTPFGFLDDLFGLTFCFVPGTPVWTKRGTGVEYARIEGDATALLPETFDGSSPNALLSITLAGLGFAAAAVCTRRRGDAEEETQGADLLAARAGKLNEEFFARWGRASDGLPQGTRGIRYNLDSDEPPFDNDHPMPDDALLDALAHEPPSRAWGAPVTAVAPRAATTASLVPARSARSRPSTPKQRPRRWPWAVLSALLFLGSLGAWFQTGDSHDAQTTDAVASTAPADATPIAIEDLRLGQRVLGENPDRAQATAPPQAEQSARIVLSLVAPNGNSLWMEAIWPRSLMAASGARVGERLPVMISGLRAPLSATVLALGPCPEIESGDGPVVTARYITQVRDEPVVELRCAVDDASTFVTLEHPYWSEDRQDFVPASDLQFGESVLTFAGPSPLVCLNRTTYTGCVYNVETTEHVYLAGPSGTLVHNACHRHHAIPKFLGGARRQVVSVLDAGLHTEFHRMLREDLRAAGFMRNIGGRGGATWNWAEDFWNNPGSHRRALDTVLETSRRIDYLHGTRITRDVWENILKGNFGYIP